MIDENMYRPEISINQDEKAAKDFSDFIIENNFTPEQLRAAYDNLLGIAKDAAADPVVEKITAKMDDITTDNGLSLNKVLEIISSRDQAMDVMIEYYNLVDESIFSDKEKKVLRSIAEKPRYGKISFYVDSELFADLVIKDTGVSKEVLAVELSKLLKDVFRKFPKNKKTELLFEEK